MLKSLFRSIFDPLLSSPMAGRALASAVGRNGVIFFLHRFECYEGQELGHRVEDLHRTLSALRQSGVDILPIDEVVEIAVGLRERVHRRPFVAFSIDDCYWDFTEIALPVFREFEAPVTGFVCPGLIDTADWFWWDKVDHLFANLDREVQISVRNVQFTMAPTNSPVGFARRGLLREFLKALPNDERLLEIQRLSTVVEVPIPVEPPSQYRLSDWATLQKVESDLVHLGAHTMSHPILRTCSDDVMKYEIAESLRRVRETFRSPSRVFCYPNGTPSDFGAREEEAVRACGAIGAISTVGGAVQPGSNVKRPYGIPRFAFGHDTALALRLALFGR